MTEKKSTFVKGAAVLAATTVIVKILGLIYKLPLMNILDDAGASYFSISYQVYSLLLTVSTAGVPVAISRMIAAENAVGRLRQSDRIYKMALPAFIIIGILFGGIMVVFAKPIAVFMEEPGAWQAIATLGPAVFFCCILAVLRGYTQGYEDMVPTSISQILEVFCKCLFGLGLAWLLTRLHKESGWVVAGSISGVVIGLGISIPVMIWYKRRGERSNRYQLELKDDSVDSGRETLKKLFAISIPMTVSTSMLNILTLLDSKVILRRLRYGLLLDNAAVDMEFAAYSKCNFLFSLPSSLIVPISISVVPAVAAAIALKEHKESAETMTLALKLMNLFAMPAALGMAVLAGPIYYVFYGTGSPNAAMLLTLLGLGSYFVCFQLVSTAMVQAAGYERVPMIILTAGGVIKISLNYLLVGMEGLGILGAPIASLICYFLISVANMYYLNHHIPERADMKSAFMKPLICTLAMGAAAAGCFYLLTAVGGGVLSGSRLRTAIPMIIAIVFAIAVYGVVLVKTRTMTRKELSYIPKGERVADLLKIKD